MAQISISKNKRKQFQNYPDILDAKQMSELLGISTKTAYGMLQRGEIPSLKIGRAYKVPKATLEILFNI